MFKSLLDNNYANELKEKAQPLIISERKAYEPIINEILLFAQENNLIISNLDLLLNTQDYWNFVELFAINVEDIAKSLVSRLCSKFKHEFLLKIFEKDKEYLVEYSLRRVCVLNAIKPYKQYTLYNFVNPLKFQINADVTIYLLPGIIEIIHLYNSLYDPGLAGNWEDIYDKIKRLSPLVYKEIKGFLSTFDDTDSSKENEKQEKRIDCFKSKNNDNIRDLVMDFLKENDYIMLDSKETIEAITHNPDKAYESIKNFLSKFVKYGISYKEKILYIPKEFRLQAYIFYFEIPCVSGLSKKQFLVLYNNTSYELVNYYEKNGFKYADPITQLMFDYIAIWSYVLLKKLKVLKETKFNTLIESRYQHIIEEEKKVDIYEMKKNYIGDYIPLAINKKLSVNKVNTKSSFYCFDL